MKLFFGGAIAVVLLGLYSYAVVFAIRVASCAAEAGCSALTMDSFNDGFAFSMSTIGGLVSALVIAELAVTQPGAVPVSRALDAQTTAVKSNILNAVTGVYLPVWICVGVAAYVVGVMWYPNTLVPLTDFGQAWLGLAVAAGYAYFGIQP